MAVVVLGVACAQPQRVVRFHASHVETDPIDLLVKSMVENGVQPAEVDAKSGIIHTEWQDTGFMYGQIRNKTATIHRRYTAVVTQGGAGADVLLRADTKRCTPREVVTTTTAQPQSGGTTISVGNRSVSWGGAPAQAAVVAQHVEEHCEPMDGLVEQHQEELEVLGRQLRAALGATPSAG